MNKILITGGSGFIGTNLIEYLRGFNAFEILSLDIAKPKISSQQSLWRDIDIRNKVELGKAVLDFKPDYVIHLAARTDLNGAALNDYDANIGGVSNLLEALEGVPNLKRVIFTSSMYVCEPGYMPRDFEDYAPHTLYGESKVQTEKLVKAKNPRYEWCIIRPTSIWGPWFGEPYNKFFHIILNRMYFHMGSRACRKTYGYVDNAIYQIMALLNGDVEKMNGKVFYIGDYEAYDITAWANEIAGYAGIKIPRIPYFCFKLAGWFGDFLKLFGIAFPMTSFRLHNMTTDNVHDLRPIQEIAPNLPVGRKEGTKKTLEWIKAQE